MAKRNVKPVEEAAPAAANTKAQADSARTIIALVGKIGTAAKKLQDMIHTCAVLALEHAHTYGDTEPMAKLYLVLPNGQRREALLDWVHENSPIRIRDKGKRVGIMPQDEKGYTPWNIEAAKATPYYEKDERAMKPAGDFDAVTTLKQRIKATKERMELAAKPENSNVVYFKDDFNPAEAIAKWEKQVAALQAA